MKEIFIYKVKDTKNIDTVSQASESYSMCTSLTILNETEKAIELIGLVPLFIYTDEKGRNYASLPDQPVIHGKWVAKSQMKYLGKTEKGTNAYAIPNFVEVI